MKNLDNDSLLFVLEHTFILCLYDEEKIIIEKKMNKCSDISGNILDTVKVMMSVYTQYAYVIYYVGKTIIYCNKYKHITMTIAI